MEQKPQGKRQESRKIRVLLHNIRSAHNVGAIFRTADAIGVEHVYLSGYTPCPKDRFDRPNKEIAKTALGAELTIPWTYRKTPDKVITICERDGFSLIGVEQDDRAVDYKAYRAGKKTLMVMGSEVRGLSLSLRKKCKVLLDIPMRGMKESLNVSVAFGVAAFRLFDR